MPNTAPPTMTRIAIIEDVSIPMARSLPNRKNISRYQDGCETRGFSKGRRSPKRLAKPSDDRSGGSAARSPCRGPSRGCQSYADRLSAAGPPGPDDSAGAPHSGGEVRRTISQGPFAGAQVRTDSGEIAIVEK